MCGAARCTARAARSPAARSARRPACARAARRSSSRSPSRRPCARRSSARRRRRARRPRPRRRRRRVARAGSRGTRASGIAIVSAAPSAIGCCAEACTRSRVPRRADSLIARSARGTRTTCAGGRRRRSSSAPRRSPRSRSRPRRARAPAPRARPRGALDRRADEQVGEQEAEEVGERLDRLRLEPGARERVRVRDDRDHAHRREQRQRLAEPAGRDPRVPVTIATTQAPTSTISSSR